MMEQIEQIDSKEEIENSIEDDQNEKIKDEEESKNSDQQVKQQVKLEIKKVEKDDEFRGFPYNDDYADPIMQGYYGGFQLLDNELTSRLRSAGKEILKIVGKNILSGKFNLTTISFPIKCMCPLSMLQTMATISGTAPFYLTKAALTKDPIMRMKLAMAFTVSYLYPTHIFEKPLNPILGETFQTQLEDGTQIYMEQTQHRPPVSSLIFEHPDNLWSLTGWCSWQAKAWINSATLIVDGHKKLTFHDGHTITYTNTSDQFNNIFYGTLTHQVTGVIEFTDTQNNLFGYYEIGGSKVKTQDYLQGEILQNGKNVCDIYGNYLGYMDFNSQRYVDIRETNQYYMKLKPKDQVQQYILPSDASNRTDSITLKEGNVDKAQENKVCLEELQRKDRRLREQVWKRREAGGPKLHIKQ